MVEKCKERVMSDTGWHTHQCSRKAVKDGYCKQHHPDAVKDRRDKAMKQQKQKWKESPQYRLARAREENAKLRERVAKLEATVADQDRAIEAYERFAEWVTKDAPEIFQQFEKMVLDALEPGASN